MFDHIPGQAHVKAMLGRAVRGGRLTHALLLHGAPGLGKAAMAAALAAAVNCEGGAEEAVRGGCGRCASCRRVEAGTHPDVAWITPVSSTIKIEQVRELIREAHMRPFAARKRVFILREADKLSEEAANSLLKILEEPPGAAMFILITALPETLLPTIRSRCQQIPFRPVDPQAVAETLRRDAGVGEAEATAIAVLSGGNPGLARSLAGSAALAEGWRLADEVVRLAGSRRLDPPALFAAAQALEDYQCPGDGEQADAFDVVDLLAWVLRDRLAAAVGGDRVLTPLRTGLDDRAAAAGEGLPTPGRWFAALKTVDEARRTLRTNANRRLAFEVLLLKLHEAIGGRYNEENV